MASARKVAAALLMARMLIVLLPAAELAGVRALEGQIVVEQPNGNEVGTKAWVVGVPYDITWSSAGEVSDNIIIELFNESGSNFVSTLGSSLPDNGLFRAIVSNDIGDDYRIKIRDGNDPAVFDVSDSDFELVHDLHLTAPDGGERWHIGQVNMVRWDAPGPYPEQHVGSPLALWFSGDAGTTWMLVAEPTNWPGHMAYAWLTPSNDARMVSESAKMAVSTPTLDPADPLTYRVDFSDGVFTNAGLVIVQPTAGTEVIMGDTIDVRWTAAGAGSGGARVDLFDGIAWTNLALAETCLPGTNNFTVRLIGENPTDSARIKVMSNDHPALSGTSAEFVLGATGVRIVAPSGGETGLRDQWQIGTTNYVLWTAGEAGDSVDVEYTTDGATWMPIAMQYPNTNSSGGIAVTNQAPFVVVGPPSASAQVRVRSVLYPEAFDTTGQFDFSGVKIASPNGGEVWNFAGGGTIEWLYQNAGENVSLDIAYVQGSQANDYETLFEDLPILNQTQTVLPSDLRRPSNYAKVRIRSLTDDTMTDESDDYFTIRGLSVTHPTDGAVCTMGTTVTNGLQWFAAATEATIARLYYSPDGVNYDDAITFGPNSFIGNIDDGDGYNSQNWSVSTAFTPSEEARIKIVAGEYECVSEPFTLRGVRITRPAEGDMFDAGAYEAINWMPSGLSSGARADFHVSTVGLTGVYTNAGLPTYVFVPGRSSFWNVDPDINPSTNAVIRMTVTSPAADTDVVAYSDPFTLRGLKLLTPTAGTNWVLGTTQTVTWLSAGLGPGVKADIYYAADGSQFDEGYPIAEDLPVVDGVNLYTWSIEASEALSRTPSTNGRMRLVVDTFEDTSAPFTLSGIKIIAPSPSAVWTVSDLTNVIHWVAAGTADSYDLRFQKWQGGSVVAEELIASSISGSQYAWSMASNMVASNVTISVTDSETGFTAFSGVFEIVPDRTVQITSPAPGTFWKVGSTQPPPAEAGGLNVRRQMSANRVRARS